MPGDAKATHPSGLGITFTEHDHRYIDDDGQHYTSGTAIVSMAKPKFDPTGEITQRYAVKNGMTVDQVKAQWKAKGDASCAFGTRLHENCEFEFLGQLDQIHQPREEREVITFPAVSKMVKHLQTTYQFLATEFIVFSPKLGISGSIDLLMAEPHNRTILLLDWKSNEKIDRNNSYGNHLLPPFEYLDDCNFIHYSIQLELYKRLMIREGYLKANGFDGWNVKCVLLHVNQETGQIEWIETRGMGYEVAELIIKHLTNIPF